VLVGSQIEILRDKLKPLVDPDAFWPAILGSDPLEGFDHVAATVTEPDIERWRWPSLVVDDLQHPDIAAIEQLVAKKIHR